MQIARWLWVWGWVVAIMLGSGCSRSSSPAASRVSGVTTGHPVGTSDAWVKPNEAELRRRLTPLQYEVTQNAATERPFDNPYWNEHRRGLYVDIVSGVPLFASSDKFDSGTGWPSFTRPIHPDAITTQEDDTLGVTRVEVRSALAGSHLGHVFRDGPQPTGLRYCMNSAALRFVPLDQLETEGLGDYRAYVEGSGTPPATAAKSCPVRPSSDSTSAVPSAGPPVGCATSFDVVILAGGCFWGMQDELRNIPGVVQTEVGYAGGSTANPTYDDVKSGRTGHAESVKVTFDPKVLPFRDLLEKWFFRIHDPTTANRQGNDVGSQYRSAIFVSSPEQRRIAEEVRRKVDQSGKWGRPVVTEIAQGAAFTRAEDYHQDYLVKHPGGYSCHFLRDMTF